MIYLNAWHTFQNDIQNLLDNKPSQRLYTHTQNRHRKCIMRSLQWHTSTTKFVIKIHKYHRATYLSCSQRISRVKCQAIFIFFLFFLDYFSKDYWFEINRGSFVPERRFRIAKTLQASIQITRIISNKYSSARHSTYIFCMLGYYFDS